jgi:hypothetical protein
MGLLQPKRVRTSLYSRIDPDAAAEVMKQWLELSSPKAYSTATMAAMGQIAQMNSGGSSHHIMES